MRKILVVDDDKYMRKLLATILNTEGYDVHIAESGIEALKKLGEERPQLLLLDYMMPGTTGMDVLKEVRRSYPDTDVIVVTGHGNEKLAVEIMKLGASDYLQKPFRKAELLDSVHKVLSARMEFDKQVQGSRILVVDDDVAVSNFVVASLGGLGSVESVNDANAALDMVMKTSYDIIISDVYMPYMDGIELLKRIKVVSPATDVIIITSSDEPEKIRNAIKNGAVDYVKKPFSTEVMREAVADVLLLRQRKIFENIKKSFFFKEVKDAERTEFLREIVEALIMALEARDPYTKGHSERVTEYSLIIAAELELTKVELEMLRHSARLHDLGKIGTGDEHLYKKGALSVEEYIPGVRHHHERYDGSGYPDGLSGSNIPLQARIISVADAFDAMLSSRPYRKAMKIDDAVYELNKFKGVQFDPDVVEALLRAVESEAVRSIIERASTGAIRT